MEEYFLRKVAERFGKHNMRIFWSGVHKWRVSINGWHVHLSDVSTGSIYSDGSDPEVAARNLWQYIAGRVVAEGLTCAARCPEHDPVLDII